MTRFASISLDLSLGFSLGLPLAWLLLASSAGAAAPATSSLSWSRRGEAQSCIGTRELAQTVEQLVGRTVFVSAARAEVSIEGVVERRGQNGWQADITVADERGRALGQRQLRSDEPSCRSLDEPLALAIALMIDPDAAHSPAPHVPRPAEASAPEIIVEERLVFVAPKMAESNPEGGADSASGDDDPWVLGVRAGPAVGVGVLPRVAFGATAAVLVEPPWLIGIEASAAAYLPQTATLDAAHGDFSLAYAAVAACPWRPRWSQLSLWVCAEIQLGRLWADGSDDDGDWQQHQFLANVSPRARVSYRLLGPLELGVGVGAVIPLVRDSFRVRSGDSEERELFRLSPVAAQTDISLGVQFP